MAHIAICRSKIGAYTNEYLNNLFKSHCMFKPKIIRKARIRINTYVSVNIATILYAIQQNDKAY